MYFWGFRFALLECKSKTKRPVCDAGLPFPCVIPGAANRASHAGCILTPGIHATTTNRLAFALRGAVRQFLQFKAKNCRGGAIGKANTVSVNKDGVWLDDLHDQAVPIVMDSGTGDKNPVSQAEGWLAGFKCIIAAQGSYLQTSCSGYFGRESVKVVP
jgi:hypothetical protein